MEVPQSIQMKFIRMNNEVLSLVKENVKAYTTTVLQHGTEVHTIGFGIVFPTNVQKFHEVLIANFIKEVYHFIGVDKKIR